MPRTLLAALLMIGCSEYGLSTHPPAERAGDPVDTDEPLPEEDPHGAIAGRICAPDAQTWVVGARVWTEHAWGISETVTGADGWFTLRGLPPGMHTIHIEKGKFHAEIRAEAIAGQLTEVADPECLNQGEVRIAVVTGEYDHIGELIGNLNLQYDVIDGVNSDAYVSFLRDPTFLAEYDLIFFNCGMGWDWSHAHQPEISANLAQYVNAGGSIYASDWAYWLIEATWPATQRFQGDDAVRADALVGRKGLVQGDVRDEAMAELLGGEVAQLNYDMSSWAAPVSTQGQVLIEGEYEYDLGSGVMTAYGPLAFRLSLGAGSVTFTSFHNENQTTLDMIHLLQEIILAL